MKKILIIGPIEDFGGRELEAGFIAYILQSEYYVTVCSTANISSESQLSEFSSECETTSLKSLLFKQYLLFRPATYLSYWKNNREKPVYFYLNNKWNYRFVRKKEKKVLEDLIKAYDLIFIIADLFSLRTKNIIEISKEFGKPVVFRTTGQINLKESIPGYLKNVNHFIHHSSLNANQLHEKLKSTPFTIIDQTAFNDEDFLKIPVLSRKPKKYLFVGRLSPEKNLIKLISFFKSSCQPEERLVIVGEGKEYKLLQQLIIDSENIEIKGFLPLKCLTKIYNETDCLIIPSYKEAGPLVGIEAMAAGRLILSTRVGAMPERLDGSRNNFWFQPNNKTSFYKQLDRIRNLEIRDVTRIAKGNRNRYLQNYSRKIISEEYLTLISELIKIY